MAAWTFADAWLLAAAAGFGRRGCSLSELIGAADAISHDIPPPEQVSRSLGRLIATGLLTSDDRRFRATSAGVKIYKQRARPMFDQASSVLRLLGSVGLIEGKWEFEPGEFDAAYEAYRGRDCGR